MRHYSILEYARFRWFEVHTRAGDVFVCRKVILAMGLQGNLCKLGAPGEDLHGVQYQLDDPDEYSGETIVVVGAGDAAIENAIALAGSNRVVLINRNEEFARCKEGNLSLVRAAIKDGRIECRYGTSASDESLCVRCNNCDNACADVHDSTSRLDREAGPAFAQIHVPTSCRHCEHPHCMKECPPDAIHRSANGEVFVDDTCIGAEPAMEPKPKSKDIAKKAVKCEEQFLTYAGLGE